jgi:hypothetical protein
MIAHFSLQEEVELIRTTEKKAWASSNIFSLYSHLFLTVLLKRRHPRKTDFYLDGYWAKQLRTALTKENL